ncbi:MAG: gluconate 2-dehydrogenase subunit 3 family protein [Acidobacteriota bacterium]
MNKNQDLTVPDNGRSSGGGINRREMVRRLMLAGGAGLALPGMAEGHPDAKRIAGAAAPAGADARTSGANWTPEFLDPHQYETLTVLAEHIAPGSTKAQVGRFIDLLLSVDTQEAQKKFLASLSAFEAESLRRFFHPYKDLTEARQNEILTAASTAKPGQAKEGQPPHATLRDHFENLKSWITGAYYSSEIGMKELGWTGQVYFTSFPGCQESVGKQS